MYLKIINTFKKKYTKKINDNTIKYKNIEKSESIKTNLNTKWMDAAFAIYQQTLQQKTKATSIQLKIPYD